MKQDPLEELDLMIPEMNSAAQEQVAGAALKNLPGIVSVRFVQGGAMVSYRASSITDHQICDALRHAGFRAATFQDSRTGKQGHYSK